MALMDFILYRLFPILLGSLSVAYLLWSGLQLDLTAIIEQVLSGLDAALIATIGVLGGLIASRIIEFIASTGLVFDLSLDERWRYLTSLSWLYFIRDFYNFKSYGQTVNIVASFVTGLIAILFFPLMGGLWGAENGSYLEKFLFGFFPLLGFLFYWIVMTTFSGFISRPEINRKRGLSMSYWEYVGSRYRLSFTRFIVGVIILAALLPFVGTSIPTIFILFVLWIGLAVEWLRRGIPQALDEARQQNLTLGRALLQGGNVNLGLNMLAAVAGGVFIVLLGSVV